MTLAPTRSSFQLAHSPPSSTTPHCLCDTRHLSDFNDARTSSSTPNLLNSLFPAATMAATLDPNYFPMASPFGGRGRDWWIEWRTFNFMTLMAVMPMQFKWGFLLSLLRVWPLICISRQGEPMGPPSPTQCLWVHPRHSLGSRSSDPNWPLWWEQILSLTSLWVRAPFEYLLTTYSFFVLLILK